MPVEITTVEHTCNVVRRQFAAEMKDLILLFVPYETGKASDGLNVQRHEFYKYKMGEPLFSYLRQYAQDNMFNDSKFIALCQDVVPTRIPLFTRKITLAAFFINGDHFDTAHDVRQHVYHMTWSALRLIKAFKNKDTEKYALKGEAKNIITMIGGEIEQAHENMLADAFSAIMLELTGKKGPLPLLARKRCTMALQPRLNYEAELFPFPIAAEGTQIVFNELLNPAMKEQSPIAHAEQMTEEIGHTYDDHSLNQWRSFALAAQEMAWMGFDKSQILGTAIYSSEDPYVRSMAYLTAEIMNLEPALVAHFQNHNPFTEYEVNERAHFKACNKSFSSILSLTRKSIGEMDTGSFFTEQARLQNEDLIDGRIIGWCSDALMETSNTFNNPSTPENSDDKENASSSPVAQAKEIFTQAMQRTSLHTLMRLWREIVLLKRKGLTITPQIVLDICSQDSDMSGIARAFEKATPKRKPFDIFYVPPEEEDTSPEAVYGDDYYA